jgi:hypothetical protein
MAAHAIAEGTTPLQMMLDNARYFYAQAQEAKTPNDVTAFRMLAQGCAKDAAPFCHPKFATIEHVGEVDKTVKIEWKLPKEMLDRMGPMHRGRPLSPTIAALIDGRRSSVSDALERPER